MEKSVVEVARHDAFTQQLKAAHLGFNKAVFHRTDIYGIRKKLLVCHQLSRIKNFLNLPFKEMAESW